MILDRRRFLGLGLSVFLVGQFLFMGYPAHGQFVTNVDLVQQGSINTPFAMYEQDLFVTISATAHDFNGYNASYMEWIASDEVVDNTQWSFLRVQPYLGGCTDAMGSNPCAADGGSGIELFGDLEIAQNENWTGTAVGLWCGTTDCFTWWRSDTGLPSQLQRYTLDGGSFVLSGYMNWTDNSPTALISGIDTNTGGIGGITVYTVRDGDSVYKTGGTSLMQDTGSFVNVGSQVRSLIACHTLMPFCERNEWAVLSVDGVVEIFDTTNTSICSVDIGEAVGGGVMEYDFFNDVYIAARETGNTLSVIQPDDCSVTESATGAVLGLSDHVKAIVIDGNIEQAYYVYHASESATPALNRYVLDPVDITVPLDFDNVLGNSISGWVEGGLLYGIALDRVSQSMIITGLDPKTRIVYLPEFADILEGGLSVVCSPTQIRVVLATGAFCASPDTGGGVSLVGINPLFGSNSTAYGIGGIPAAVAVMGNVDLATAELMSTIGLVLLTMVFIAVPAWRFGSSPPFFFWFIIIMMDLGVAVVLGWLEPLYFAVMVVVAALGAGLKWSGVI